MVRSSQSESSGRDVDVRERNGEFQSEAVVLHVNLTLPVGASQYGGLIPSAVDAVSGCFNALAEPNDSVVVDGSRYPARSVWFGGARTTVSAPASEVVFSIFWFGSGVSPSLLSSFAQRAANSASLMKPT